MENEENCGDQLIDLDTLELLQKKLPEKILISRIISRRYKENKKRLLREAQDFYDKFYPSYTGDYQ